MIQKIEILNHQKEVVGTITHIQYNRYIYRQKSDTICGVSVDQTSKGVWVHFSLTYVDSFKTFLSNKNINIIK